MKSSRRAFIFGLGIGGLTLTPPAKAALRCSPFDPRTGVQICESGIDGRVRGVEALQRNTQWCWAACISAVFDFHGVSVQQDRIVQATYGRAVNLPAIGPQIAAATSRTWRTDDGEAFTAQCEVLWDSQFNVGRPDAPAEAARELADDQPLIIGTGGHAMVLTAMTYAHDAYGRGQPMVAIVRDPWPGRGRRQLSPQEWYGTGFLAKVHVY
jgi:hypothetical protein